MAPRAHGSGGGKRTQTPSFSSPAPGRLSAESSHRDAPTQPTPLAGGLYIVATPIGNLGDITLRALAVLRAADVIACEDTRVTLKLLRAYGIAAETTAYHDHNANRVRPRLIKRLQDGESVALVSDAGTPLIADPGYKLTQAAIDAGILVTTVPGASAVTGALTVSGLPPDRFLFAGFLPPKRSARQTALRALRDVPASLVFYESARRLAASLADMAAVLGDRPAAVVRELTKRHEEVRRDDLAALAARYAGQGPPRGEVIVVVAPPGDTDRPTTDEAVDALLREALAQHSLRDAVADVAATTGRSRRDVYARALAVVGDVADDD